MRRRTLDIVFSVGGVLLAGLLLVLGLVLQNQADFAKDYVHDQLSAQKIIFTPEDNLTDEEKQAACLVEFQAEPLTTGNPGRVLRQRVHRAAPDRDQRRQDLRGDQRRITGRRRGGQGRHGVRGCGRPQLEAAAKALDAKVQSLFRGETLRGLLLTSYGFSIFGERAQQAALVCFGVALVLLLASIAGFVHAFTTPKDQTVS